MLKVTYIHHDCFLIETDEMQALFDYWDFAEETGFGLKDLQAMLHPSKPLYVLVSHHHKDHYSPAIFALPGMHTAPVHYILSRDTARFARHILTPGSIYKGVRPLPGTVTVLHHSNAPEAADGTAAVRFCDGVLTVRAFGSTDIGNSYVLETRNGAEKLRILHAGDLNAWIWKDESTPEEVAQAQRAFETILEQIAQVCPRMDVAMFPVDSRLGTDYFTGARLLLQRIRVARFYPMHFCLAEPSEQEKRRLDALAFHLYANPSVATDFIGLTRLGDTTLMR